MTSAQPASRTFGSYVLEQPIGSGAMGEVWRAVDTRLGRPVALKLLSRSHLEQKDARERFLRESRAASALNHPNIVTVFEAGEHEGQPFLAMELIEGATLRTWVAHGPLQQQQAIDIVRQVLMGLAQAHDAGIIHRDIKPENLMLRADGFVKILDFGLAQMNVKPDRLTSTDVVMGTPLYMSPEQVMSQPLDSATDVYSVGTVLYELIAGKVPFEAPSMYEFVTALMEKPVPPIPRLPRDLWNLLSRALEKKKQRRYPDARAMLADVLAFARMPSDEMPAPAEASLVVLPFATSREDEELADGITDEIIASLEKVHGLRVIARSTSMRYRGRDVDPCMAGRELNVNLALEGSMRRSGSRVRVVAGMIDTHEGFRVWGDRFESRMGDIFDMQDEIAGAIVSAIKTRFASVASMDTREVAVLDSQANELYHKAAQHLSTLVPQRVLQALADLEKAIELQPDFAPSRAKLSEALMHSLYMFPQPDPAPILRRALDEAHHALRIDPQNADALYALGLISVTDRRINLQAGRQRFREALRVAPNHVQAMSWLSMVTTMMGNCEEGEELARRAISRDPQGVNHYMWLTYALFSQGRFDEGADAAERGLRVGPKNPFIHAVLIIGDMMRQRWKDLETFVDFIKGNFHPNPFLRLAILLYETKMHGLRWQDIDTNEQGLIRSIILAERFSADISALSGDVDTAVEILRGVFDKGYRNVALLDHDPFLDGIRTDPRYLALVDEMLAAIRTDEEFESEAPSRR
jgi:TolB-like protein